jgi:hypothetical protein
MKEISTSQLRECLNLTAKYVPVILPAGWESIRLPESHPLYGQRIFQNKNGLAVIFTADNLHQPGKTWIHVSMSRRERLPTYDDMTEVKALFVGRDRQALQIFPPESKHINIYPFCLHLCSCVEGDGLPDFGAEGTI